MTQVIVIHGGTTFSHYDDYLDSLRNKTVSLDRLLYKPKWKEGLQGELGSQYQVLLPTMPNASNARYSEWAAWFTNITNVIEDDCILIGHSLGAIFLAKYLSTTRFSKRIKGTILVAAPFGDEESEDLTDFKLNEISELFINQAGETVLYFGLDDPVIALSEVDNYKHFLPNAEYHLVSAPDHFVRQDFPELIKTIQKINNSPRTM